MEMRPQVHHRGSIRLKGYDYSQSATYFVTICAKKRELYFEKYRGLQEIVRQQWEELPQRFPDLTLDEFVIMPNHIHGIIIVGADRSAKNVGATLAVAQNNGAGARPAPTVGEIVGTFKSLCIHDWLPYIKENKIDAVGKFWQRNYYEHVVRNEDELNKIGEYIQNNPLKWDLGRQVPRKRRLVGAVKGHNITEISFPGSPALWAGSFIKKIRKEAGLMFLK
jgi:putative transposase